jgi:hypothetical protein
MAHACNPSYSGGRDQENCGLKPVLGNSSRDHIPKVTNMKRNVRVAQAVRVPT